MSDRALDQPGQFAPAAFRMPTTVIQAALPAWASSCHQGGLVRILAGAVALMGGKQI
jgi:hypothetical protein